MSLQRASRLISTYSDSHEKFVLYAAREGFTKAVFHAATRDFEMHRFMQMWGSSCGGIYDMMDPPSVFMEDVSVYVYNPGLKICYVYFGGRFGYCAEVNEALQERIDNMNLPDTNEIKLVSKVYEAHGG